MSDVHPGIRPLAFLVGTWRGDGAGDYPTIEPFSYDEEIVVDHVGKPFLRSLQRTRDATAGTPLHTETGYWRWTGIRPELVIAQPTGVVEVLTGELKGTTLRLRSVLVGTTPTAKEVATTERRIVVEGDVMRYRFSMAAVGREHGLHLEAELRRS